MTDGAAVYEKPDFDSKVLEYLADQTKIHISKKPTAGIGGMGIFHLIRFDGKRVGYVPDTDIRALKRSEVGQKKKPIAKTWEKEEQENLGDAPLYFRRYLGGAIAMVDFTEKFSGRKLHDNMTMYGLRMMGPGTLFDGPPLDFNFWFSVDKPGYYDKFSSGSANGFLLFGDVNFMLPLYDGKTTLISYGLGLMWVYTSYRIPVNGVTFDSQEFRIGFDLTAGVGKKIGKFMLRGDAKYYYEKTQYLGYLLSLMGDY